MTKKFVDFSVPEIKRQMSGREIEFLGQYLTPHQLSGKAQPCPCCEGEDRYRTIKDGDGAFICRSFRNGGGDFMDHVAHTQRMSFFEVCRAAVVFLGLENQTPEEEAKTKARKAAYEAKRKQALADEAMRMQTKEAMNKLFCYKHDRDGINEEERQLARDLMELLIQTYKK